MMKWNKKRIYIQDLPKLIEQTQMAIKAGNPMIEKMRFVFIQEGTDIPFMYMPFDFIDLDPKPTINEFYLYQALEKSNA